MRTRTAHEWDAAHTPCPPPPKFIFAILRFVLRVGGTGGENAIFGGDGGDGAAVTEALAAAHAGAGCAENDSVVR